VNRKNQSLAAGLDLDHEVAQSPAVLIRVQENQTPEKDETVRRKEAERAPTTKRKMDDPTKVLSVA